MQATPQTLRDDLARIYARRYGRELMTYTVGDTVPAAVVEGAWDMATEVLVRKYRGR